MKIGIDVVENQRIETAINRSGQRFINIYLNQEEQAYIGHFQDNIECCAGLWAAKVAAVKALGTGFQKGISFQDIHIKHDEFGAPYYHFSGEFLNIMQAKHFTNSTLSISHCATHAIAVAVLTK